ncbi:MAG: hypothetical protein IBJ00_07165 [Alphaproteobacteria bacterium]|nr:hypothetical protein [Alphaproteobacteria bacterium]
MKKDYQKLLMYRAVIPGLLAVSLVTAWVNRDIIIEDIFYGPLSDHRQNQGVCAQHGIPPTEWPAALTR